LGNGKTSNTGNNRCDRFDDNFEMSDKNKANGQL
jgi:hypothetical protein